MLRGLLTFRCPLSVFARCIKCGTRVRRSCCFEEKFVLRKLLISLGDRLIFKRQILIFDSPLSILWEFIKYGLALADSRPPQKIFAAAVTNGASAGCSICAAQSQLNDLIANWSWAG